ncbi:hypothetical protein ACIA8E_27175 [Streptomyces sp. NPDC051664]|uniref:hypothetical protein n=1 Tax=Streptomyces sp. NPDC051664 TaxID=3365668 RepID=UPI0037A11D05
MTHERSPASACHSAPPIRGICPGTRCGRGLLLPADRLRERAYVDIDAGEHVVGNPEFVAADEDAQRRSITVLTNHNAPLRT